MKILLVCLSDFRAPGARQTQRLARALTDRGHECLVLIEGELDSLRFSAGGDLGIKTDRFTFLGPRVDSRTRAIVSAFGPEIVHCYEPRTAPLAASLQLSRMSGAKLCVRFADDDETLARAAGGEGLKGRIGRPAMLAVGTLFPARWPYKHPLLYKRMLARAGGFDAITPALASAIEARYGVDCEGILPALPPAPPARPSGDLRLRLGLPPESPLILYTGSVFRAQFPDLELLLRAFADLASEHLSTCLVHTGRIAPRYGREDLLAMTGPGASRTHFLGFLENPSDLEALMAEASVLVQPGAPTDFNRLRLPAKVHDYLLAGRPTVTFAAGFGELLDDRVHAVLTYGSEPQELAEGLAWVLDDEERAAAIGVAGRERALELFAPAAIAEQTLSYYRRAGPAG